MECSKFDNVSSFRRGALQRWCRGELHRCRHLRPLSTLVIRIACASASWSPLLNWSQPVAKSIHRLQSSNSVRTVRQNLVHLKKQVESNSVVFWRFCRKIPNRITFVRFNKINDAAAPIHQDIIGLRRHRNYLPPGRTSIDGSLIYGCSLAVKRSIHSGYIIHE